MNGMEEGGRWFVGPGRLRAATSGVRNQTKFEIVRVCQAGVISMEPRRTGQQGHVNGLRRCCVVASTHHTCTWFSRQLRGAKSTYVLHRQGGACAGGPRGGGNSLASWFIFMAPPRPANQHTKRQQIESAHVWQRGQAAKRPRLYLLKVVQVGLVGFRLT